MDHHAHTNHDPSRGPGYEVTDVRVRPIVIGGVAVVVVTAVVIVLLRGMVFTLEREEPVKPVVVKDEAKLDDNPFTDVYSQKARLRLEETETLGHYSYDAKTGVATLPIDRAIDLIAERGAPKGKGPKTEAEVIRRDDGKKGK